MPDVWTNNPEKLKNYLLESGSVCGVEPRVIPGHNPEWTCTYDSKGWLRDIYIHPAIDFYYEVMWPIVVVSAGIGILIGLGWGKRFWRNS